MKKLTHSKRDTVRFLIKRAIKDLETARTFTFKAYGSHAVSDHLLCAIETAKFAVADLPNTKISQGDKKTCESHVKDGDE